MTLAMKQQRLNGLSDGIFAIVMTLLAIELHVPNIVAPVSDILLWNYLIDLWPTVLSLILSFALLFTYWRAHHFLVSVYAKTLTVGLANLNALFLFLITLIPFCAHLLGSYNHTRIAIGVYGINVILIGLTLLWMRLHIELRKEIPNESISHEEKISGYVRIIFPIVSAVVALLVSVYSPTFSFVLFTSAILFNLLPARLNPIHNTINHLLLRFV